MHVGDFNIFRQTKLDNEIWNCVMLICWKDGKRFQDLLMTLKIACDIHMANKHFVKSHEVHGSFAHFDSTHEKMKKKKLNKLMTQELLLSSLYFTLFYSYSITSTTIDTTVNTSVCIFYIFISKSRQQSFHIQVSVIIKYGKTFDPLVCAHCNIMYQFELRSFGGIGNPKICNIYVFHVLAFKMISQQSFLFNFQYIIQCDIYPNSDEQTK